MANIQPFTFPTTSNNPFFVEYGRIQKKPPISGLGATRTLLEDESGSLILLDRAAGIVITLPAPEVGLHYEFIATVSVTSNSYKIITDAGTTLLIGQVLSNDTDTSGAAVFFAANGSTHIAITMGGSTTGGLIGTIIRLTCVSATQWYVEAINNGSGSVATPFATS